MTRSEKSSRASSIQRDISSTYDEMRRLKERLDELSQCSRDTTKKIKEAEDIFHRARGQYRSMEKCARSKYSVGLVRDLREMVGTKSSERIIGNLDGVKKRIDGEYERVKARYDVLKAKSISLHNELLSVKNHPVEEE